MALGKHQEDFSILEAVDYLSSMADIDAVPQEARSKMIKVNWLDSKAVVVNKELVKRTFKVIHNYLKDLYEKNKPQLQEPQTQRAIQAIMVLAKEAAQKLDKYTELFKEVHGVTRLKEYQALQHYYLNEIMQKFQESLEKANAWKVEAKEGERELKDLEIAQRDKHYELFLIKNEQGLPFFDRSLLSHIKLTPLSKGVADPFIHLREIQDADLHEGAKEILELAKPHIDDFYKEGMHLKEKGLVSSINKALLALMLTAHSGNLLKKVKGKSCLSYYADFHFYLREALSSTAYSRLIAFPPEPSDNFSHTLMNLAHALCCFFFFRIPHDRSTLEFIHELIEQKGDKISGPQMWESFLITDDRLREKLKEFSHGPVLKTLNFIQNHDLKEGFDPINQENYPAQLFDVFQESVHITVLRTPCPTKQVIISQAEVIPEFKGLLRYFKETNVKHLLINLQDRTDPIGEQARSLTLEHLQYEEEFLKQIVVVTFPTASDFYLQIGDYENKGAALEFIESFKKEIASKEGGFFFPDSIPLPEKWISDFMLQMHKSLYLSATFLSHKERLSFIEIFYQFFILKLVEITECNSLSFTCKDALDTGAAANVCFYSLFRLLSSDKTWTEEERDFVLWMFYSFSLMVRERPIDQAPFLRVISALFTFHSQLKEDRKGIIQSFSTFYSDFNFLKIQIKKS